jgi:8-amino-7-oxononanoate synthase
MQTSTAVVSQPGAPAPGPERPVTAETHSLVDFYDVPSPDLFEKCTRFQELVADLRARELFQTQYRVEVDGPLDHRIRVRDELRGQMREMVCFDSNGYLGLQRHPRVVAAARRALDEVGYGTPSAQLLGGTSRHLRELEDAVSAFYGREATLVFPSGYAANVGALTALLRLGDLALRDRFAHASIADGCRYSGARLGGAYAHQDMADLERLLQRDAPRAGGKLVVTDGVFSMHAAIAPLPDLRAICDRHGAKLMVDDAHGLGVLGPTGRGIEEHWNMEGRVDVLMGTFSKAPGTVGGYVTGSTALIDYLRFFARSSMFTAALPAAICAGVTESLRVIQDEPEHRERLWDNSRRLWQGLAQVGLHVPETPSPIVTAFVGNERLLAATSRALFAAGFKVGSVCYPAVPRGEAVLRLSVSARHERDDIDRVVATMAGVARAAGILGKSREAIRAIGERVAFPTRRPAPQRSERPTLAATPRGRETREGLP